MRKAIERSVAGWRRGGALVLLAGALAGLGGCNWNAGSGSGASVAVPEGSLQAFASRQAFETYLKQALAAGATPTDRYYALDIVATAAPTSGASAAAAGSFSATNLQEAGVDEADRLKSDGRHLFIFGRAAGAAVDSLQVRLLTGEAPAESTVGAGSRELARLDLPAGAAYGRAYLASQRPGGRSAALLAVGEGNAYYGDPPVPGQPTIMIARDWFAPTQWGNGKTALQWIDLATPAAPALGRSVTLDGHYVASRRIGETVYVVSRYLPQVASVATATLDDLLPKWSLDGVAQGNLVDAERCYQPAGTTVRQSADLIVVSAIDLAAPEAPPRTQCLTGGSEAVYVSPEALYVATSRYDYNVTATSGRLWATYPVEASTDLHKFALTAAGPTYRGSGSVAGHLGWEQDKKSFRMGEHEGVLRVVTSLGQDWDGSATTRLALLREGERRLDTVSTLPNAARPAAIGKPGERLYATRFVGQRAYLVTFRITDPLYVLDLADPADPRIAGELAVPGYSDYLHPLGERWLIGVGKDAIADSGGTLGDGRGAWYQGVKVALFDVADAAHPREVNSVVIGQRGTQSAALSDHHAFTFLPSGNASGELGRLALPVVRHATPAYGDPANPSTWYDWTTTGLHLLTVNDSGLLEHGEMTAEQRAAGVTYPAVDGGDDRGFLVGEEVHYLHGTELRARRW